MTDRLAELGALQYAVENLSTAGTNPNRLGLAGYIHAAYTEYQAWAAANPGVNPNRLSAKGRIYGYFYDYGFSPLNLFSSGEVGAWYDPSDLTTMFQDRAGTTPVTADGQPVGLILDKSKGLVLGPELVTNGTFDSDISGFTPTYANGGTTSWDSVNKSLKIVSASNWQGARCSFPTVVGTAYRLTFNTLGDTSAKYDGQVYIAVHNTMPPSTPQYTYPLNSGASSRSCVFVATASTMWLHCVVDFAAGAWVLNLDNISVKELPGNHASQATAASRPLKTSTGAADWTNYDAVDDVLNTTFPSSLGSDCTVCRANVGAAPTILTGQTIGTSYADSTDNAGLIIINRALTGQETTDVTAWLTAKGAT